MLGVFAEFERAMIQERVRAGLARAKSEGKRLGRPRIAPALEARIKKALAIPGRPGVRKIAEQFGVDPGTVQRISRPFSRRANSSSEAPTLGRVTQLRPRQPLRQGAGRLVAQPACACAKKYTCLPRKRLQWSQWLPSVVVKLVDIAQVAKCRERAITKTSACLP